MYVGIHNWVGLPERKTMSNHIHCLFLTDFEHIVTGHKGISALIDQLFPESPANSDLSFELLTVIDPALSKFGWSYTLIDVFVAERNPRGPWDGFYGISFWCLYKISSVISSIGIEKSVEIQRGKIARSQKSSFFVFCSLFDVVFIPPRTQKMQRLLPPR